MRLMCPVHAIEDCLEERDGEDGGQLLVCSESGHVVRREDPPAPAPQSRSRTARRAPPGPRSHAPPAAWSRVEEWDRAIEKTMLSGQYAGRPVYLDLEEDELATIARELDPEPEEPRQAMIEDVSAVLALDRRRWLGPAVARLEQWERSGADGTPPILAVLGVLILAAEGMREDEHMAAHNYYGRLCVDVLGLTLDDRNRIAAGFRKDASRLFEALNEWLDREEGARGLPTATPGRATNRYVHYPVSQALLRLGDRERLFEFFAYYGLTPGSALPVGDLARLLADYASRGASRLGANLTGIVQSSRDSLLRLSEVVAAELESWDGTTSGGGESDDLVDVADLRLAASLAGFPKRSLRLSLLTQSDRDAARWTTDEKTADSLGSTSGSLRKLGTGWQLVEVDEQPVWSAVLTRNVTVDVEGTELMRRPRRVVALRQDDTLSRWVEVERVSAGEDAMLLVVDDACELVAQALEECARPGWRQEVDVPGLPPRWTAFLQVQIMGTPSSQNRDLAPLVASAQGSLTLGAGLRLPGQPRRWHRDSPPEVRLSLADHEEVVLHVLPLRGDAADSERVRSWDLPGIAIVPLADAGLPPGDYAVRVREPETDDPIVSATLRLRDGSQLAVSRIGSDPLDLGHRLNSPRLGVSAETVDGDALRGGLIEARLWETLRATHAQEARRLSDVPGWVLERREPSQPELVEQDEESALPDCFITGAHYYVLPPATRGRPSSRLIEGRCSYCGKRDYWPSKPVKKGHWARRRRELIAGLTSSASVRDMRGVEHEQGVSADVILDALTHLRDGSASDLNTVVRAGLDALHAAQLVRDLQALGHLEIERDDELQPVAWRVAPSALSVLPAPDHETGRERVTAVLTGARPPQLLDALAEAIARTGITLERSEQPRPAPMRIAVTGPVEAIHETAGLVEAERWPLKVSMGAAFAAVRLMPPLREVIARLPTARPPGRARVRRLDLRAVRWNDTPAMSAPGVYRVDLGYRSYQCLRTEQDITNGVTRTGPQELVKHAAAAALGREPLCSYHEGELSTPSLIGLPGLLERAAVLCSGFIGEERADGRRVYTRVPDSFAREIGARLLP